jgi:hypothetical protein
VAGVVEAAGLKFSAAVVGKIRARIERDSKLTRSELSREVCRWQGWRAANGKLREMACRLALLELERRGELRLPARRSAVRTQMAAWIWQGQQGEELCCGLEQLGEIELVGVSATEERGLSEVWNELIAGYHYLGYTPLVGAQKRYLIHSEHHGCVGALGFSAAARRVGVRDQWIGWSDAARARHLHRVVSNSRFLILPWVKVRNLASRVLALAARRVVQDWEQSYGYTPVLLESFVEQGRFSGTCYRAANWVELGSTRGRGRQDRERACERPLKTIFAYPLRQDWREQLGVKPSEPQGDWAEQELSTVKLNDARLCRRFVCVVRDFYSRPQAHIPAACNGDRAKTKAVYRFLDNEEVSLARLLEPHQQKTLERMREHQVVLAVQDTTSLNYTAHTDTEGLGRIGPNSAGALGIIVHDTLAITPRGLALGVLDAQVWTREGGHQGDDRPIEQKESVKWLRSYQAAARAQAELKDTRVVSVGDREADLYDLFAMAREHLEAGGPHVLVRARENRNLKGSNKPLWESVEAEAVAGYREITIPPRPGKRARTARLSVRFREVILKPPQGKTALGEIRLWAVHARERRPPTGAKAVEWMLLSTMEVGDFEQACEKLDWYTQRWMIEVFHRTLKSGCRIEDRRLGTARRLENCLAIDMVVASRIMHLTWLNRTSADLPCTIYFEDAQWKALYCFRHRTRIPPRKVPTAREVIGWIANLGGYLGRNSGRKSDRPPGTQALWEGLQRADDIIEAVKVFTNFGNDP